MKIHYTSDNIIKSILFPIFLICYSLILASYLPATIYLPFVSACYWEHSQFGLCPYDKPSCFLSLSLFSSSTRCSKLTLYFPCPALESTVIQGVLLLLLVSSIFRTHDLDHFCFSTFSVDS